MNRLLQVIAMMLATGSFWVAAFLVRLAAGPGSGMTSLAVLAAFGASVFLWVIWGLEQLGRPLADDTSREKAKRGDDRAALLLSLLTDDERQALRQRLVDDLQGDGEAVSLADLLSVQERRRGGS